MHHPQLQDVSEYSLEQAHGSEKKMAEHQAVSTWKVVLQIYIKVDLYNTFMVIRYQLLLLLAQRLDSWMLYSFITTMEPEASFTVRLEEQAGEKGVTKTSI